MTSTTLPHPLHEPLHQLAEQYEAIDAWIAEHEDELAASGGALPPELEAKLDALDGALPEKVERLALRYQEYTALAEAAKREAQRLARRAKVRENAAAAVKRYLQRSLERAGKTRVETPLAKVWTQRNSTPSITHTVTPTLLAVWCGDPARSRYVREKPAELFLNGDAVLADYEAGRSLPEEITVSVGTHLRLG